MMRISAALAWVHNVHRGIDSHARVEVRAEARPSQLRKSRPVIQHYGPFVQASDDVD